MNSWRSSFAVVAAGVVLLAAGCSTGTSAPSSSAGGDDVASQGDLADICLKLTNETTCDLSVGDPSPPSSGSPSGTTSPNEEPSTLHLYFGEFYTLADGKKSTLDGVSGTIHLTPESAGANTGKFVMKENFTQGYSMTWMFELSGNYKYTPSSDVYEFEVPASKSMFGGGTLTAANDKLIGTLTQQGDIGTTFDIPYTTE